MKEKKAIGINQRIPLHVLEAGLITFLNNNYSIDYIQQQLRLDFKGENRIKKGVGIVNKIIPNSLVADYMRENKDLILNALKSQSDRNIILISIVNIAYPFCFKVTELFGKFFKVQDVINTSLIKSSISKEYGSNRSTPNAVDSIIPMLLEAGFFERASIGIYQPSSSLQARHKITKEIFVRSYAANTNNNYKLAELFYLEPYFFFLSYWN